MNLKTRLLLCGFLAVLQLHAAASVVAQDAVQNALKPVTTRAVGAVSSISGKSITLKTDAGADLTVLVSDSTKLLQLKPGQKDLKDATPLALADLKTGDRILVRGAASSDGKQMQATSVIAMTLTDIADKQARDRAEWQRNGVGGLVKSIDPPQARFPLRLTVRVRQRKSRSTRTSPPFCAATLPIPSNLMTPSPPRSARSSPATSSVRAAKRLPTAEKLRLTNCFGNFSQYCGNSSQYRWCGSNDYRDGLGHKATRHLAHQQRFAVAQIGSRPLRRALPCASRPPRR